jgi:hypothetical protein
MALGVADARSTITLRGRDQASKSINKAKGSLTGMGGALNKVKAQSAAAGQAMSSMVRGDVIGAVQGMSGALAGAGGLTVAAAGATVAVAAIGAAVAVAAVKFTNFSVEINRMKAGMDAALGQDGLQKAIAISNALGGVSAESIGKVASRLQAAGISAEFTSEQLTELTQRATVMGKTGDEALEAFAAAIEKGNTRALKSVGTFINATLVLDKYAKAHGTVAEKLEEGEKQMAIVAAIQEQLNKKIGQSTEAHDRQDRALSRLDNAWLAFKVAMSDALGGPMVGIVETLISMTDKTAKWAKALVAVGRVLGGFFISQVKSAINAMSTLWDISGKLAEGDLAGAMDAAGEGAKKFGDIWVTDNIQALKDAKTAIDEALLPSINNAASASLKVGGGLTAAFNMAAQLRSAIVWTKIKEGGRRSGGVKSKEDPAKVAFDAKVANLLAEADLEDQHNQQSRANQDAMLAAQESAEDASLQRRLERQRAYDAERLNDQFAALDLQIGLEKTRGDTAIATAKAVAVGAAQQMKSEQQRAGLMALIAAAEAAMAFYAGNYPGGVMASFAAIQYARAALTSPPTISHGGSRQQSKSGSAPTPSSASSSGAGSSTTVILQKGFMVGTAQELGSKINGMTSSLRGTGMATAGAA